MVGETIAKPVRLLGQLELAWNVKYRNLGQRSIDTIISKAKGIYSQVAAQVVTHAQSDKYWVMEFKDQGKPIGYLFTDGKVNHYAGLHPFEFMLGPTYENTA